METSALLKLIAAVLLACVLPWLASLAVGSAFGGAPCRQDSLHQALELAGTFIALGIAILLLIRLRREKDAAHLLWVVLALVGMGSMDGVHAVMQVGWAWSWLRHAGTFIGGLLFALVWIPLPAVFPRRSAVVASAATLLAVAGSLGIWGWGDALPPPWVAGSYSIGAKAANALGGLGFFAAAVFFVNRYVRLRRSEDLVFAGHTMLFGTAGLMFGFSTVWDADWWLWHGARLLAYGILLFAAQRMLTELYERLDRHTQELEGRVAERTAMLSRSEARWTAAIENFAEGVIIATEAEQVIYWNPAARRMHGYTQEAEGIGPLAEAPNTFEIWTIEGRQLAPDEWPMRRIKRGEPVRLMELRLRRSDQGWEKTVLYSGTLVETAARERLIFLSVHDITQQREAEQVARQYDERLRRLVESNIIGVATADIHGVKTANDIFLGLIGSSREDLDAGRVDWAKATAPEHRERDARALEQLRARGWCSPYEKDYIRPDGSRVSILIGSAALQREPEEWICFTVDLTEKQALEQRLREKQKLESIGLLAGGIAHDFNNLLVGIMGNASLAEDMLPLGSNVRPPIEEIMRASERAAHLTRQMLAYSGKGRFFLEPINVSQAACDVARLTRSSIPDHVEIRLDLDSKLPAVEADLAQIQQLLMNLLINAGEAIGDGPGVVTLRTRSRTLSSGSRERDFAELPCGDYASVEVSDTGCGMDNPTRAKIFDPFFTTKFTGRGLGLAAVSGIVRGHNGGIRVTSRLGEGTTFEVLLPVFSDPKLARGPVSDVQPDMDVVATVLVIDEDETILRVAKATIEQDGHAVLLATSGEAALHVFARNHKNVSAVLLDLSMAGMGGRETLRRLRQIHPEVPVLISSGYSELECLRLFAGEKICGFVQKPYTTKLLRQKVRSAIAGE